MKTQNLLLFLGLFLISLITFSCSKSIDDSDVVPSPDFCLEPQDIVGTYSELTSGVLDLGGPGAEWEIDTFPWNKQIIISPVSGTENRFTINDISMGANYNVWGDHDALAYFDLNSETFHFQVDSLASWYESSTFESHYFGSGTVYCIGEVVERIELEWANNAGDSGFSILRPE